MSAGVVIFGFWVQISWDDFETKSACEGKFCLRTLFSGPLRSLEYWNPRHSLCKRKITICGAAEGQSFAGNLVIWNLDPRICDSHGRTLKKAEILDILNRIFCEWKIKFDDKSDFDKINFIKWRLWMLVVIFDVQEFFFVTREHLQKPGGNLQNPSQCHWC